MMKTIFLLVEDDARDAGLLKHALQSCSNNVQLQVVSNAVDATHYIQAKGRFAARKLFPLPTIILLDIRMPLFDGFEFLTWLRNEAPAARRRIPVVVMSGSDRWADIERAYELGANAYVMKPTGWVELKRCLCGMTAFWSPTRPRKKQRSVRSTNRNRSQQVERANALPARIHFFMSQAQSRL